MEKKIGTEENIKFEEIKLERASLQKVREIVSQYYPRFLCTNDTMCFPGHAGLAHLVWGATLAKDTGMLGDSHAYYGFTLIPDESHHLSTPISHAASSGAINIEGYKLNTNTGSTKALTRESAYYDKVGEKLEVLFGLK